MKPGKSSKQACAQCHRCGLGETRPASCSETVQKNARIMLIGEGPVQEDPPGRAVCRPGGKLLDDMLEMILSGPHQGLHRQHCQMPSAAQPRPPTLRSKELQRMAAAADRTVDPAIIVSPRPHAAATALIKDLFRITREHDSGSMSPAAAMAIYHPPPCCATRSKRPETFVDL